MEFDSPRGGKLLIDPKERDAVQTVYFRRVEEKNGRLINVDFDKTPTPVKDPWKEQNPNAK
jgi:branched-chain amino acid transport system substrate-binding protein